MLQPGAAGHSYALKGQLDCSQQDATIPARARRAGTQEHWEKSCAVLGKKACS